MKIEKYKIDKLLCLISILFLLFNTNVYLNYFILSTTVLLFLIYSFKQSIALYAFISIWVIEVFQSQYQVFILLIDLVIFIKAIQFFINNKLQFRYRDFFFIILLSIYLVFSVIVHSDFTALRTIINVFAIVMIRLYFIRTKDDAILTLLFKYFLISVVIAISYGLIHQNFDSVRYANLSLDSRFYGVHSPNYMALYINIATIILLFSNVIKKKFFYYLFLTNLYIGLILTQSSSGLILGTTIILIYTIYKIRENRYKIKTKHLLLFSFFILFITLILTREGVRNLNIGAVDRLINRVNSSSTLNALTNERSALWGEYWEIFTGFGLFRNVFGSAIFSPMEYSVNIQLLGSHSTYIDLLWFVGFLGIILFLLYILLNIIDYKHSRYFSTILAIKTILIVNMFTISLMSNRFFYIMFLL